MNKIPPKIRHFVDFSISFLIFPSIIRCTRLLSIEAQSTIADRVFLYVLARKLSVSGDILEIGSFKGASALLLAAGNSKNKNRGRIHLVEPSPQPSKQEFLDKFKIYNFNDCIQLIDKTSEQARQYLDSRFKLIFIDGNHEYEYVKKDILLWSGCLNDHGVIAFHDNFRKDVKNAIQEFIKENPEFIMLGNISNITYVSKNNFRSHFLLVRLRLLSALREIIRNIIVVAGYKIPLSD